ncbi:MAG: hypothetical protein J5727_08200 [Kiritimatiellae bacterium]|nr:hypothetical protein [Kiritimatiellia bacterium]
MKNMKLALATAAIAACTTVFAADEAADDRATEGQGVGAVGWTPVQIGLCAPVSFPWGFDWDLKGFGLDLFYCENVCLKGLSIGGLAGRARDDQDGVLIAGVCNWNDADVRGLSITLGANLGFGDVYGIDVASFGMRNVMKGVDVNLLASYQKEFVGWQTSGVCNFTEGACTGASFALALNMAKIETGLQVATINSAQELHGVQIGVVNIAEECPWGLQIGVINIILDNTVKILPLVNGYFGSSKE